MSRDSYKNLIVSFIWDDNISQCIVFQQFITVSPQEYLLCFTLVFRGSRQRELRLKKYQFLCGAYEVKQYKMGHNPEDRKVSTFVVATSNLINQKLKS